MVCVPVGLRGWMAWWLFGKGRGRVRQAGELSATANGITEVK